MNLEIIYDIINNSNLDYRTKRFYRKICFNEKEILSLLYNIGFVIKLNNNKIWLETDKNSKYIYKIIPDNFDDDMILNWVLIKNQKNSIKEIIYKNYSIDELLKICE